MSADAFRHWIYLGVMILLANIAVWSFWPHAPFWVFLIVGFVLGIVL